MIASEKEVAAALRIRFAPPEWAMVSQVCDLTGGSRRRVDAIAMNLWPSRGLCIHGFEIKRSRSDWLNEKKNPAKADAIIKHCEFFWVVTAFPEIIQPGELPPRWGHLSMNVDKKGLRMRVEAKALNSNRRPIARGFAAILLRRATEMLSEPVDLTPVYQRKLEKAIQQERELVMSGADFAIKELSKLREQLGKFETTSGIKINTWEDGAELGMIVRELLSGGENIKWVVEPLRRALKAIEDAQSKWQQIRNGQNKRKKR